MQLGVDTVPVLVGPVSYLLLSKLAKGVEKSFDLLSLLPKILPIYKEVIAELKGAGATWIQFDEPLFVMDLEGHKLQAFSAAYAELESTLSGLNVLVETYFADVPAEAYKTLTSLKGVTAFGFDLIRGTKTLDLIKSSFPEGKYLFAGVVDGRNIWANDLAASLITLQSLEGVVGKGIMFFQNHLRQFRFYLWLTQLEVFIVLFFINSFVILCALVQTSLLFQPPALFSTPPLILLTRLSSMLKSSHG